MSDSGYLGRRAGRLGYGGVRRQIRLGGLEAQQFEGRVLFVAPPIFDLGSGEFGVGVALDPESPGGTGFGGVMQLPDGSVWAPLCITGTYGGDRFEVQTLRMFVRNAGTSLDAILRGLYLTASLAGGGHVRTAYFRADAETGSTGFLNAAAFAVKSVPELRESWAIHVSSEGAPGKNVGVYLNAVTPYGTGVVIGPSTFAHVQYRTALGAIAAPAYSEETVALTGAVQDSAAELLPAGVLIRAVLVQAPAGVVVAAGDALNPARFLAATSGGGVGMEHHRLGLAAQTVAGRVRLTVTGQASGSAKVVVFYERFLFEG